MWCGCCWLLAYFSCPVQAVPSCAAMCPCTAVAVGPWLVRYCTNVTHSSACTVAHTQKHIDSCTSTCTHPLQGLAEITCFTRTLERGRRDVWQALTFPFQLYFRYNCPQSVKTCCVHVSDQKPRFITKLHQTSLNSEIMLMYLYCSKWTICWFIHCCVVTQNWEPKYTRSVYFGI